jgi:hypothetical protein
MMQNRSVNERVLNGGQKLAGRPKDNLLLECTFTSSEDDPLLILNAEANATYDKTNRRQIYDEMSSETNRKPRKKVSKGRKHRGKQEIQPIHGHSNPNASVYHTENMVINPEYIQFNENHNKIELEQFSNKNSYAKYMKNLQFREKLPKKHERENSTPSRITAEIGEKNLITGSIETETISRKENTSTDQYKGFLNSTNLKQDSYTGVDTDHLLSSSIASKDVRVNELFSKKDKKFEMRSSSISSSNISLISESTSSNELIGWSYQQTRDGKLYNMTEDREWKQLYRSRYVNERVEAELIEFKDEIEKKFKISKCKNFKFPRIGDKKENLANKSCVVNIDKSQLDVDQNDPILLSKNYVFDYKMPQKDVSKINKKNIEFFSKKQESTKQAPKKLTLVKTFDEDTKHQLSKSVPRSSNNSKPRKSKHKRQVTLFKFEKDDNS